MTERQMLEAIFSGQQEMRSDIKQLQSDVKELKNDMVGVKSEIAGMKSKITGLESEIIGLKEMDRMILDEVERVHDILDKHRQNTELHKSA